MLSMFIWTHKLIRFETLIFALMDNTTNVAFELIAYLLFADNQFQLRVNAFLSLFGSESEWWNSEKSVNANLAFHSRFSEVHSHREGVCVCVCVLKSQIVLILHTLNEQLSVCNHMSLYVLYAYV